MTSNPNIQAIRFVCLSVISAFVSIIFLGMFAPGAGAATIDPGAESGSYKNTNGGGDGCVLIKWEEARSIDEMKVTMGADGALCGNPATVESGLKNIAPKCLSNHEKGRIFRVQWVVDAEDSWSTSNTNGPDVAIQSKAGLTAAINALDNSWWKKPNGNLYTDEFGNEHPVDMLRQIAIDSVQNEFNVVSCSWIGPYMCKYVGGWDDYVHALDGKTILDNSRKAEQRCFERCPDDAAQNAGTKIPNGSTVESHCLGPDCEPVDPSGACETAPVGDEYDWPRYAYGSELGYGLYSNGAAGGLHPYTYTTTVYDGGVPVRGQKTFAPSMDWKYTAFGEFYNQWCNAAEGCSATGESIGNNSLKFQRFKQAYNNAIEDLATESHVAMDLDEDQRAAMAQGRVVNVVESEQLAYAFMEERVDRYYQDWCHFRESWTWNEDTEEWDYSSWSWCDNNWTHVPNLGQDRHYVDYEYLIDYATPQTTQAFQVITTHCNSGDFATLNGRPGNSTSGDSPGTIRTGDDTNYYSASAVSDIYSSVEDLPWGGANTASSTYKAKFFDRVCSYEGVLSDPETNRPTNERQRAKWVYFRDGEWNELALNYFTPATTGVIEYNGEDPVSTHLARDPMGTPAKDLMNFRTLGPKVNATDKVFVNTNARVPNQRQWMSQVEQEHYSDSVAIIPGAYTSWEAWGTWASSQRNPQVLQARWKFEPVVSMVTASSGLGFGRPGGAMSWTEQIVEARVAGMIESVHNSNVSYSDASLKNRLQASTGTGNDPTMDSPLSWGEQKNADGEWTMEPSDYNGHYYSVRWVRAVGE